MSGTQKALMGSTGKQRFQEFLASGTFTPSAGLLAAGGVVEVLLVGGGGGANIPANSFGGGGGGVAKFFATVASGVTVTIGAGGAYTADGGDSSFGSKVCSGGKGASTSAAGASGSSLGRSGTAASSLNTNCGSGAGDPMGGGLYGFGRGGQTGALVTGSPNSGNGGERVAGATGGSGYCLVSWFE